MKKFSIATLALLSVFLALPAFGQQAALLNYQIPGWQFGITGANVYFCLPADSVATCIAAAASPDWVVTQDAAGSVAQAQPFVPDSTGKINLYSVLAGVAQIVVSYTSPTNGVVGNRSFFGVFSPDVKTDQGLNDGYFTVSPLACVGATSGTAGAGNDTLIVDGSVPALKISSTAAAGSTSTFTCQIAVPTRFTAGKGIVIQDITYLYSVQTTTATSMVASTLGSFTAPVAGTSEAASSATLVATFGGAVTQTPVVGSANLTAVSAGQYYSEKVAFGTPVQVSNLQNLVFTFAIAQSASAAQIVTTPGLIVHYSVATP